MRPLSPGNECTSSIFPYPGSTFQQPYCFLDRLPHYPECIVIPSFTLQPLVENAIQHGIEKKSGSGQVRIRIEKQDRYIRISVTDNGAGMDRKTLDTLRFGSYIPKRKDSGIGVGNVATRLKMLYPDSSFSIFSLPGIGTCVRLIYPAAPPYSDEKGGAIWQ